MKQIAIIIIFFAFSLTSAYAQKKEISAAADQVKSGKNLAQAEQSMLKLLEKPENQTNHKIYRILNAAIQKQYEQLNEKVYLKQSVDTAAMFLTLHRVFTYAFMTDSVDLSFRKKNGEFLGKYIANLYSGGIFFFERKKYAEAYKLFDMYITSKDTPLVGAGRKNVKRMKPAAFRALCCGYMLDDYEKTVKHKNQALLYKKGRSVSMQYLAETYQKSDSTYNKYIETLTDGVKEFPCEEYFYTNLINYHLSNQRLEKALGIADSTIVKCPGRERLYYIKANILLNLERYMECIVAADSALAISKDNDEIFYIAGIANLYLANDLKEAAERNGRKYNASTLLETAKTHFEEYRQRCPDRKDRWGTPLYHIYLNLNKGEEFEEISKILKQSVLLKSN